MKNLINKWYRNHSLVFKILLFILTTFFIVYLFPKTGKFRFSFEKGKPWQSETLYAPFDFSLKKTEQDLEKERRELRLTADVLINFKPEIETLVLNNFQDILKSQDDTSDSLQEYQAIGTSVIKKLYRFPVLDEKYTCNQNQIAVLITDNQMVKKLRCVDLRSILEVDSFIDQQLIKVDNTIMKSRLKSLIISQILPNAIVNEELIKFRTEAKVKQLSSEYGLIKKGQLIITKDQVVNVEKLKILNSLRTEFESQYLDNTNRNFIIAAYSMLVALALLMLLLFLKKYRAEVYSNNTKVSFIFFNIVVMVLLTTIVVKYNSQYIYVIPLCILPLVLKAFFDARLGLFVHVLTVMLLGFIVPNSYEYMFLQIIAGIVTILTVSELYKRANLFISVGQITLIYVIAYFAFYVIHEGQITSLKLQTFGLFLLGGLATLFVQPLIYIYEKLFGLVSDVSLLELSDTNSKLLKQLSNAAPGSFHHSLNVANLAEAAANEIGANAMLVRVGALYHDIGKMSNPTYFTENQSSGYNPHNELAPKESAKVIIDHVIKGIEIAKKNNLPDRIIDFIRTHHGTSMVYYFYRTAKAIDDNIAEEDFTYPGPKPFSKETAILMMCDSVEAASKSLKDPNTQKLNSFVESIIDKQIEGGQFLNANITFKEIQAIKKILKVKLANIFHLRIEYPE